MNTTATALWATNTNTVKVHAEGCAMLKVGTRGRGLVKALTLEEAEEMRERGYTVINCKCRKG